MNCPSCNTENPDDARFCFQCGAGLTVEGQGQRAEEPGGSYGPTIEATGAHPNGELVPRSLGELLSETFAVYRSSFGVLWRIAFIAQIPVIVGVFVPNVAIATSLSLVSFFIVLLASGATTYAVSQQYLGRTPTVGGSYVASLNHAISLLVAFVVFALAIIAAVLLSFILIGIPLLFYIAVVWFFYVQAIMIEGAGPITALGRSRELVRDSWWRIFGIGIVFVLVLFAATLVASIPRAIFGPANETLGDLLVTLASVFVIPLGYVGATLVYFDLRVRKEGYNRQVLASEVGPSGASWTSESGPFR